MKRKLMSIFSDNGFIKGLAGSFANKHVRNAGIVAAVFLLACGPMDTGDLTGVQGRRPWFHPQPPGTIYVPSGTFHTGQADQDIFASYIEPNKQMTMVAFWMDETEITNNEYRQFVAHVIDSIARYMIDEDELFTPEDDDGNRFINYYKRVDWDRYKEELEDMFYNTSERFRGKKQIDTRKLFYKYQWFDYVAAANLDRDKYNPMDRGRFIKDEETLIYPDTLCWVRDFTYSYNEPMSRVYFWHPKYDDYPVVGVNWHQANAFCAWRTQRKTAYWEQNGNLPNTEEFRLPSEYEWEYASRGGRIGNKYPWGGPYARNSKGCMLANFKPLRGNYGADGGVYPVRADSYFPNDFGLYNMSGNVSEWTSTTWEVANNAIVHDLNGEHYRRIPERGAEAQATPKSMKRKVIRGGSWKDVAYFIECGARTYEYQDTSKSYVGFRCVQTYIGRSNKDKK
ncbi:MAG: SUMF1/EgtB/PvdO family nonheme iron enzyme [Bacteroidota bacterium]|jgi:sulfatase modifying factor 1